MGPIFMQTTTRTFLIFSFIFIIVVVSLCSSGCPVNHHVDRAGLKLTQITCLCLLSAESVPLFLISLQFLDLATWLWPRLTLSS